MKKISLFILLFMSANIKMMAQNVGIGTNAPASLLHVKDGSVLFSGFNSFPDNPSKPPVSGKGTRTFWYSDKAAFRTGGVYNDNIFGFPDQDTSDFHNWDKDSIGVFSFAAGFNTKAKGDFSFAMGQRTSATGATATAFGNGSSAAGKVSFAAGNSTVARGMWSTAFGNYSQALGNSSFASGDFASSTGIGSTAMGSNTEASGKYSTALGIQTIASGDRSTSVGDNTTASGAYSTALGTQTVASGDRSTSMGDNTNASGDYSTAMGEYTVASGDYSTAIGKSTKAIGYNSLATGYNSTSSGAYSTAMGINANTNNHANSFCIAGASNDAAAVNTLDNQMMMRFDNYTFWISSSNYAYLVPASNGWAYTSDINKKENFQEMNGETVLKKISGIPFYSWNFKANDTKQYRHYGIMAQHFYNAFGKDDYGFIGNDTTVSPLDLLGVAYSGIKALEKRTEILQEQNDKMAEEIAALKMMKAEMEKLQKALDAINKK